MKGVIANLDGASVVKVPKVRLPENFGFMLAHPSAAVAPVKLEDYRVHQDPPRPVWCACGGPNLLRCLCVG